MNSIFTNRKEKGGAVFMNKKADRQTHTHKQTG